jgi:hypothetical protein
MPHHGIDRFSMQLSTSETVDDLVQAIREFELRSFDELELRRRAAQFSPDRFLVGLEEILADVLQGSATPLCTEPTSDHSDDASILATS